MNYDWDKFWHFAFELIDESGEGRDHLGYDDQTRWRVAAGRLYYSQYLSLQKAHPKFKYKKVRQKIRNQKKSLGSHQVFAWYLRNDAAEQSVTPRKLKKISADLGRLSYIRQHADYHSYDFGLTEITLAIELATRIRKLSKEISSQ